MITQEKILVTGAAGFIGYHVCQKLIKLGYHVVGLDNINEYYDKDLKYARLKNLGIAKEAISNNKVVASGISPALFSFVKTDLIDKKNLESLFETQKFTKICHLAAQAGVRYSLENPSAYIESNIVGFLNILEACRNFGVKKLVYASSSSVYGSNEKIPFSTSDSVDQPISLYAATKKSNELMAHTYSHLFGIETIGLRFFTVYGPWGRPDMAMFLFTDAIINGKPIKVFNQGNLSRDFTYVDDVAEGVEAVLTKDRTEKKPYSIYNIGNGKPVKLLDFIESIEKATGKTAQKVMLPMQPGDVEKTWADTKSFIEDFGYQPKTNIKKGVGEFVVWYGDYYN